MRRPLNEQVLVRLAADKHTPTEFWRDKQRYRISRVQNCWKSMGAWWRGEGENFYFRVVAEDGIYDLCLSQDHTEWRLVGVYD